MSLFLKTISSFVILSAVMAPTGWSDDSAARAGQTPRTPSLPKTPSYNTGPYTGAGMNSNWDRALNAQRQAVHVPSSVGQIPAASYRVSAAGKVPVNLTPSPIYQSEHSTNPLSRPSAAEPIAVRQAQQALQSAQLAVPAAENSLEEPQ